jgi:hypothetical protein
MLAFPGGEHKVYSSLVKSEVVLGQLALRSNLTLAPPGGTVRIAVPGVGGAGQCTAAERGGQAGASGGGASQASAGRRQSGGRSRGHR